MQAVSATMSQWMMRFSHNSMTLNIHLNTVYSTTVLRTTLAASTIVVLTVLVLQERVRVCISRMGPGTRQRLFIPDAVYTSASTSHRPCGMRFA